MRNHKQYKLLSVVLILAYVLSACSSVPALPGGQLPQGDQSQAVVFSGTVEAMGPGQWVVSGQSVSFSNSTAVDANIRVGDPVKVEAVVDQDGNVTAVRIESAGPDDLASGNSNDGTVNANDGNLNDNASSSNDGQADNSNSENSNANANGNDNGNNDTASGPKQEVSGMVQAITTESITINGVVYMISNFTEFKDLIGVGDTVKVYAAANADGTFTIREIEKTSIAGDDDNSNSNSSNDDPDDSNENANSNDDNGNDHENGSDDDGDDGNHENGSESNNNG